MRIIIDTPFPQENSPGPAEALTCLRLVPVHAISRLHPLSDPCIAAFIVISRLKSYAKPRIAVILRRTRLKRAVNSQPDLYLPISRLELPSLLQNARPNLNICVTYSARPTRHDKRGEADAEAAAADPGASGFPSSARLVPKQHCMKR